MLFYFADAIAWFVCIPAGAYRKINPLILKGHGIFIIREN